jgi:hypothetical protein
MEARVGVSLSIFPSLSLNSYLTYERSPLYCLYTIKHLLVTDSQNCE